MTRIKLIATLAMGLSLFMLACESGNSDAQSENNTEHNTSEAAGQSDAGTDGKGSEVSTTMSEEDAQVILSSYLKVKDALVMTDGKAAQEQGKAMVEAMGKTEDDLGKKIFRDASQIAETSDVEQQRDHFFALSNNVTSLVKATGANEGKLYLQFCPMARNNQGASWLSLEEEVNNPYFGDVMLHCGKVEEEL